MASGSMNPAMHSLTDSTHWPKFAPEGTKPQAERTPPVPISKLVVVDSSSEASSNIFSIHTVLTLCRILSVLSDDV